MLLPLLAACIGLESVPEGKPSGDTELGGVTLDVTEVAFGGVDVGDRTERSVTFTSGGERVPIEAALADAQGIFSLSSTLVEVDGTAALTVGFTPAEAVDYDAELTLTVDGGDTLVLPVTGTGLGEGGGEDSGGQVDDSGTPAPGPDITADPMAWDFGSVDLGDTSSHTFTLRNDGDDDLLVEDATAGGAFEVTGGTLATPQVISPGGSKTVEVSFSPSAVGAASGSLRVSSSDGDTPVLEVDLSGEGVDLCDICAPIIDVDTGSDPTSISDFFSFSGSTDSRTITVQNIGDQDLTVTAVSVNNDVLADCGRFAVSGWGGRVTLAPWATTSFQISYTTSGSCFDYPVEKLDSNVAHILSDDPTTPDWTISLQGVGL